VAEATTYKPSETQARPYSERDDGKGCRAKGRGATLKPARTQKAGPDRVGRRRRVRDPPLPYGDECVEGGASAASRYRASGRTNRESRTDFGRLMSWLKPRPTNHRVRGTIRTAKAADAEGAKPVGCGGRSWPRTRVQRTTTCCERNSAAEGASRRCFMSEPVRSAQGKLKLRPPEEHKT
jgi:hypothetical protein